MTESAHEQRVIRLLEEIARTLRSIDTKDVRDTARLAKLMSKLPFKRQ